MTSPFVSPIIRSRRSSAADDIESQGGASSQPPRDWVIELSPIQSSEDERDSSTVSPLLSPVLPRSDSQLLDSLRPPPADTKGGFVETALDALGVPTALQWRELEPLRFTRPYITAACGAFALAWAARSYFDIEAGSSFAREFTLVTTAIASVPYVVALVSESSAQVTAKAAQVGGFLYNPLGNALGPLAFYSCRTVLDALPQELRSHLQRDFLVSSAYHVGTHIGQAIWSPFG